MSHSLFSPSSAHRWIPCPASVKLSQKYEDESSPFAVEGSVAHLIAENLLKASFDDEVIKDAAIKKQIKKAYPDAEYDYNEAKEHGQDYVSYIEENAVIDLSGKQIIKGIEVKCDFSHLTPTGEGFGTVDAFVINKRDKIIHVIDYKYGQGIEVTAKDNWQLILYALGIRNMITRKKPDALRNYKWSLCIFQPRKGNIGNWVITDKKLLEYEPTVKAAAGLAMTEFPPLNPGEIQCRFCPHRQNCDARADALVASMDNMLEDADEVEKLNNDKIADILDKRSMITAFIKDIEAEARSRIELGKEIPGYEMSEGRARTQWKEDAHDDVKSILGDDGVVVKLIGITEARKHPKWKEVEQHTEKVHSAKGLRRKAND